MSQESQVGLESTASEVDGFFDGDVESIEQCFRIRNQVFHSIKERRKFERNMVEGDQTDIQRGIAQWVLQRWKEAAESLESSSDRKVEGALRAECLLEQGEFQQALKLYGRLAEKFGDVPEIALGAVRVHRELGDIDRALEVFEAVDGSLENTALYQYEKGFLLDLQGEYAEAREAYDRSCEIDPTFRPAFFRIAYNEALRGDEHQAIEYYRKCASIEPTHEGTMVNLGILYEDTESWDDAIQCYETILEEDPSNERARLFKRDAVASMTMYFDEDMARRADKHNQSLQIPISDFELSVRSRNCLEKMNIRTLGDLVRETEQDLLSYKNFGETSLSEIKALLTKRGLRLGMGRLDMNVGTGRLVVEDETLQASIDDLDFSIRCRNCLVTLGIEKVSDLVEQSETDLLSVRNFGKTSLDEIKAKLTGLNLSLRE